MKKYNIFLVDADNTLLDFHASSSCALKETLKAYGREWKEEYEKIFTSLNNGLWEKLEKRQLTRERLIRERFALYLEEIGQEDIPDGEFNERYLTYLATHPIYINGAREFLEKLNGAGRVFIVTNGTSAIQKSRFDIAKLYDFAEDVFVSETIGADKPSPIYTEYVEAHIPNFDKRKAVWIGDSLTADIRAANEAGIDSVWYNPGNASTEGKAFPDYEAENFGEILEILQID